MMGFIKSAAKYFAIFSLGFYCGANCCSQGELEVVINETCANETYCISLCSHGLCNEKSYEMPKAYGKRG